MLTNRIDQIKYDNDILTIIGHDASLKRIATTGGGEYAGPCPFCGGHDRLRLQPERGLWWCRQCSPNEHWQDVIAYVQRRDSVSFAEAVARLGGGRLSDSFKPVVQQVKVVKMDQNEDWQQAAAEVVTVCESALWADTPAARGARVWLNERGLSDETLRTWRTGFNSMSRKIGDLWVESGVTIPYFGGRRLRAINVRRPRAFLLANLKADKYKLVKGSRRVLFGTAHMTGKPDVVIVEGEFDAMIVWQQARDLVDVITMGAAKTLPAGSWLAYLLAGQRFYILTDNDPAGEEAAALWLGLVGAKGTRQHVLDAKDITEYWQHGGNVQGWLADMMAAREISAKPRADLAYVAESARQQMSRDALPDGAVSQPFADYSAAITTVITLDQIADGELQRRGLKIVGFDPDLYGEPWAPKIVVGANAP